MKVKIEIDLDEADLDKPIRDLVMYGLRKKDRAQSTLSSSDGNGVCDKCGKKIAGVVVEFCRNHSDRFGGKVFCRDCQGEF